MARNPIKQRIELDGGKEFQAELKALGAAGEEAFAKLQAAAGKLTLGKAVAAEAAKVTAEFERLKGTAEKVGTSFAKVGSSFDSVIKRVGLLTFGIAGVTAGLVAFVKAGAETADNLDESAQAAGVAVEKYQAFAIAAEQAGVAQEGLQKALSFVAKNLITAGDAAEFTKTGLQPVADAAKRIADGLTVAGVTVTRGGQKAAEAAEGALSFSDALKAIGVSALELKKQSPDEAFKTIGRAIGKLPEGLEKTRLEIALFGKSGADLAPLLNNIKSIDDAEKILTDFGVKLDENDIKAGSLSDTFVIIGKAAEFIRVKLAAIFAPSIEEGLFALLGLWRDNKTAILAFAESTRDEAVSAIKDLFAVIKDGADAKVNSEGIKSFVLGIQEFGRATKAAITGIIIPAFTALLGFLDTVAEKINSVFGTKLDGKQLAVALAFGQLLGINKLLIASFGALASSISLALNAGVLLGRVLLGIGRSIAVLATRFPLLGIGLRLAFAGAFALILADLAINFGKVEAFFSQAGENIVKLFSGDFIGGLKGIFDQLADISAVTWLEIIVGAAGAVKAIRLLFAGLSGLAVGGGEGLLAGLLGGSKAVAAAEAAAATAGTAAGASFSTAFGAALLLGLPVIIGTALGAALKLAKDSGVRFEDDVRQAIADAQAATNAKLDAQNKLDDEALSKSGKVAPLDLKDFDSSVAQAEKRLLELSVAAGQGFKTLADRAKGSFVDIATSAQLAFSGPGFTTLADRAKGSFVDLAEAAKKALASVDTSKISKDITALNDQVEGVVRVFNGGKFKDFGKTVTVDPEPAKKALESVGTTGEGVFNKLIEKAKELSTEIAASTTEAAATAATKFADISKAVADVQSGGGISGTFDTSALRPSTQIEDRRPGFGGTEADSAVTDTQTKLAAIQELVDAALHAIDSNVAAFGTSINAVWDGFANAATVAFADAGGVVSSAVANITASVQQIPPAIDAAFSGVAANVQAVLSQIEAAFTALVSNITAQLAQLQQKISDAKAAASSAASSGGSESAFAAGGFVSGPGTGTSDSIPARLSAGEFVQKAAAVKYYSPAVMHALNQMRVPAAALWQAVRTSATSSTSTSRHTDDESIRKRRINTTIENVRKFASGGLVSGQAWPKTPRLSGHTWTANPPPSGRGEIVRAFAAGGLVERFNSIRQNTSRLREVFHHASAPVFRDGGRVVVPAPVFPRISVPAITHTVRKFAAGGLVERFTNISQNVSRLREEFHHATTPVFRDGGLVVVRPASPRFISPSEPIRKFAAGGLVERFNNTRQTASRLREVFHHQTVPAYRDGGLVVATPRFSFPAISETVRKFAQGGLVMPRFDFSGLTAGLGTAMGVPGYAQGGLVRQLAPASPGGAPVSHSASPTLPMVRLDLSLNGQPIGAVDAPRDVADKLTKFARQAAPRAIGRAPSWK